MNILPVGYVSQLYADAFEHNNDCGAACGVMLVKAFHPEAKITVDEFYNLCQPTGDVYLSAGQITTALARLQVVSTWKYSIGLHDLFDLLHAGRPVIALINYGVLVQYGYTELTRFRGAHFVVIVGMDIKNIHIHDPYHTDESGADVEVPIDVFMQSWGSCDKQGNPNYCAVVAADSLYDTTDEIGDVLYKVRVTAKGLTMRDGAGTNYRVLGYLKAGDVRDVLSEKDGWGEVGIGRWISLKYTEKVS